MSPNSTCTSSGGLPAASPMARSLPTRLDAIGLAFSSASSKEVCARSTTAEVDNPRRVSPVSPTSSTSTRIGSPLSEGNSTKRFITFSLCFLTVHRQAQGSYDELSPSILLPSNLPPPVSLRFPVPILLSTPERAEDAADRLRSYSKQSRLG